MPPFFKALIQIFNSMQELKSFNRIESLYEKLTIQKK